MATPSPVYLSKHVKHGTQNIQNDCHQWIADIFIECTKFVFGRGFAPDLAHRAYNALPDSLAGLRWPTYKGEGRGIKGKKERKKGGPRKHKMNFRFPVIFPYTIDSESTSNQGSLRGGTRRNAVPIVKVFKNALGGIANHFPDKNALNCRILYIQCQNFSGWYPGPQSGRGQPISHPSPARPSAPGCLDLDTNLSLARQRSYCSCFTKRPLPDT